MRDCVKNRAGFDRVLMAVAATFLTVSATSAFAQAEPARNSTAELAIDAAVPQPEPANVPPPTVNDFKPEASMPVSDTAKSAPAPMTDKAAETNPSDAVTAPATAAAGNDATTAP
ncbi:MAG TPA: murein L,D-transpeptidase, partial [Bradyrhizobium sp.]|nr:murein L,D-transpeptidase [Bradyrhizobium sp.]